jgi:riboflavin synthase
MFTGLTEKTGKLLSIKEEQSSASVSIECDACDEPLVNGESIAVQGACLTVTSSSMGNFNADLLKETLGKTTFSSMKPGAILNLERALKSSDRLGGHIVTGHVDGTGAIQAISNAGRDWILTVKCGSELLREIVVKGSVAINGVSLTVSACTDTNFAVNIIPFTWQNTNFSRLRTGEEVNIETDIIAKYVNKYQANASVSEVTVQKLEKAGFI